MDVHARDHSGDVTIRGTLPLDPHKDQNARLLLDGVCAVASSDEGAFAGDVSPAEAFKVLSEEPAATLVDTRTVPEWAYVGVPDLSGLGKAVHFLEWAKFPAMSLNEGFLEELNGMVGGDKERAVFFICRSGQRSRKAAIAATADGFRRAYNVETGFEGSLDVDRHRSAKNGWKADGLPWVQS